MVFEEAEKEGSKVLQTVGSPFGAGSRCGGPG
jgi:hypothetical protein